jgi:leader peptidase (prepilin peptidase)/N-methyltransferase
MTSAPSVADKPPADRAADRRLGVGGTRIATILAPFAIVLCIIDFGISADAFVASLFSVVLVYLAVFDVEHRLIPNRVVLPAAAAVLALQIALHPDHTLEWIGAAVGTAGFFFATAVVYPPGLGMGDVKLALLIGAMLGTQVVGAVLFAAFSAAIFGAALMLRHGVDARKRAMPFGPFLAFGALLALFLS